MKLHEMSAEQILYEIEKRSDALLEAEKRAGVMDADLKAWEATSTLAVKDAGEKTSMSEAEKRVKADQTWCERYLALQHANADAAHAKRHYQAAVLAQEMWRSERATMRAVA